jgi:NADPH:quinone reductase-like Zn-dependent oxidoreductase
LSLGATPIDYSQGNVVADVQAIFPNGADVVFDCVGDQQTQFGVEALKQGGKIVSIANWEVSEIAAAAGKTGISFLVKVSGSELEEIATLVDEGKVRVAAVKEFPLSFAKEAFRLLESGRAIGKIVLTNSPSAELTMQAAQVNQPVTAYETDLSIVNIPIPSARPGHALVRVGVAGVNPVDKIFARGYASGLGWPNPFPLTIGIDFAGVVEAVGEGVTNVKTGDEVFGMQWSEHRPHDLGDEPLIAGSFAQYLLIDANKLAIKPAGISFDVAAAIPVVSNTAYQCLFDIGKVTADTKVLILGGSSAVGFIAVQLAKKRGAFVATTCSSRTHDFVSKLGADIVVDYNVSKWEDHPEIKYFDVVFDTIGEKDGLARATSSNTVKSDGVFVSIAEFSIGFDPAGHPPLSFAAAYGCRQSAPQCTEVAEAIADGSIKMFLDGTFPFSKDGVVAAMNKIESGKSIGKNVIRFI